MSELDSFNKWFEIITKGGILDQFDMNLCIKELLPGHSFRRSGHGPRANKFIYSKYDKVVYKNRLNYEVGMQALRMAANTDYKKAILKAYDTKKKINSLLLDLRQELDTFDIGIIVDDGEIDIRLDDSD